MACVTYLKNWLGYFYPDRMDIVEQAQQLAATLGGDLKLPQLRWKYAWLEKVSNRKIANQAQVSLPNFKSIFAPVVGQSYVSPGKTRRNLKFLCRKQLIIEAGRTERQYWRDLWRYRELFYFLAWRDFLVRYKQTAVGVSWSLIRPVLMMLILTMVMKVGKLPTGGAPVPLFLFAGAAALAVFFDSPFRKWRQHSEQHQPGLKSLFSAADRANQQRHHQFCGFS